MSRCHECDDIVEESGEPVCWCCFVTLKRKCQELEAELKKLREAMTTAGRGEG